MLDKAKALLEYKLNCMNEEIGSVKGFYFDDRHWAIRYLAADTGPWLPGRQVLISPHAVNTVSRERHRVVLGVTRRQIEDAPSLDPEQPVSPQFEEAYHTFHGWPKYWRGPYTWGSASRPDRARRHQTQGTDVEAGWAPRVRRTSDVNGAYVQTTDGEMGHVEDLIIDGDTWAIRYLIISAQNWWPGKRVLVSPQWIQRVMWERWEIFIGLSGETIRQAPEYSDHLLVTREYETRLHGHYGRRRYWLDEPEPRGEVQ
jgi:sporulation protein YlmC with PRC-barrel domain